MFTALILSLGMLIGYATDRVLEPTATCDRSVMSARESKSRILFADTAPGIIIIILSNEDRSEPETHAFVMKDLAESQPTPLGFKEIGSCITVSDQELKHFVKAGLVEN